MTYLNAMYKDVQDYTLKYYRPKEEERIYKPLPKPNAIRVTTVNMISDYLTKVHNISKYARKQTTSMYVRKSDELIISDLFKGV